MPADASTHAPSQFDVGHVIPPVRRSIGRDNIDAYRSASGDHNRIHYDDEFAASSRFGGVIAHGMLTLAMISEMMAGAYGSRWLQSGSLRVRFRGAAHPGDLLEAVGSVTKSESVANGSRLTCNVELRNVDNGNRIITGSATVVVGSADTRETAQ
ncbi:MAG: MaoC family dehydratase [Chloroflexota bacterium]|nr:MaoC family dehydratase [Chloroflexota bacterium]MDE2961043.1 MaoC family dehydratase [Chloroflexota bacterium]